MFVGFSVVFFTKLQHNSTNSQLSKALRFFSFYRNAWLIQCLIEMNLNIEINNNEHTQHNNARASERAQNNNNNNKSKKRTQFCVTQSVATMNELWITHSWNYSNGWDSCCARKYEGIKKKTRDEFHHNKFSLLIDSNNKSNIRHHDTGMAMTTMMERKKILLYLSLYVVFSGSYFFFRSFFFLFSYVIVVQLSLYRCFLLVF